MAAAATAAVGISGCAPASPTEAKDDALASTAGGGASKTIELNGQTLPASMAKPNPIPEDVIVSTVDCDVLVIGAGISGCSAVTIAVGGGVKVICVEKGSAALCHTSDRHAVVRREEARGAGSAVCRGGEGCHR